MQIVKKYSWWDKCSHNEETLRSIRSKATKPRTRPTRKRRTVTRLADETKSARTPCRKKRPSAYHYQTTLTPRGPKRGAKNKSRCVNLFGHEKADVQPPDVICLGTKSTQAQPVQPQYFHIVQSNDVNARVEFVLKNWQAFVATFDSDNHGFTCICGEHVSLLNRNFRYNVKSHFEHPKCQQRRRQAQFITRFFRPVKKYARPDPAIFCRGLWDAEMTIDGTRCLFSNLGEYANQRVYYVSSCCLTVENRNHDREVIRQCIHSANCLGHALDVNNRLRPERYCTACASLKTDKSFRKLLLDAQNPERFELSCRLPSQYLSWKQLQVGVCK